MGKLEDLYFNILKRKPLKLVVRVKSENYFGKGYAATKKVIKELKRKSDIGISDFLADEADEIGKIINLNEVQDGVYDLIIVNKITDFETGHAEDWDYKLVKHE